MRRFVACLVWSIALSFLAPHGHAHEWYAPYTNKSGASCCGGKDCHELPDAWVRQVATGYAVRLSSDGEEFVVPLSEATPSEDQHFHICIWGGERRCFFAPLMGA